MLELMLLSEGVVGRSLCVGMSLCIPRRLLEHLGLSGVKLPQIESVYCFNFSILRVASLSISQLVTQWHSVCACVCVHVCQCVCVCMLASVMCLEDVFLK